jgi:hypothetical protein
VGKRVVRCVQGAASARALIREMIAKVPAMIANRADQARRKDVTRSLSRISQGRTGVRLFRCNSSASASLRVSLQQLSERKPSPMSTERLKVSRPGAWWRSGEAPERSHVPSCPFERGSGATVI